MVTICTGWVAPHEPRVLKAEDGVPGGTSHGICPDCERDMIADAAARQTYNDYLERFPINDPRD